MLPPELLTPGSASFVDLLARHRPDLLPGRLAAAAAVAASAAAASGAAGAQPGSLADRAPHGTTIVALTFDGGVLMAGDRRATMGNVIAQRDIEKVFPAGTHSAVGIAGSAGIAVEIVRVLQLEIEHYEKIEGVTLSLEGQATMLARMIRDNLGAALQGLAALPLFAGVDPERPVGRIWSYDVVGGKYAATGYDAIGSGSLFAKGALKKTYRPGGDEANALATAVEALYDAADDDSATGGPDTTRGLYPVVAVVTADGYRRLPDGDVAAAAARVLADRAGSGPQGA